MINSKILSSDSSLNSEVYLDEYIQSSQTIKPQIQSFEVNKTKTFEKHVEENIMNIFEKHVGQKTITLKRNVWIKETTKTWGSKEDSDLDEGDEQSNSVASCSDELSRRAEDFIARVNRHRKLELSRLQNGCY